MHRGRSALSFTSYKLNRFLLFSIFLVVCVIIVMRINNKPQVISPLADTPSPSKEEKPILKILTRAKKPDDLRDAVKEIADAKWKNYSILVMDLNSDFVMGINETSIYDAASVNKIPILAALYHEVKLGSIDLGKSITLQSKDVQDYGTGSMRYDEPGTVYSIKTVANLMIKKSDNTAAYILANHILTLKSIQSYMESIGLTQTDMMKNTTSNKDIGLLFTKIFGGNITDPAQTEEMIGLLKDTDFEDRLPALLPEGATAYHKIGTIGNSVHDAGVIKSDKASYYIGIFTSNITNEVQTSKEIAEVSAVVYDFMTN